MSKSEYMTYWEHIYEIRKRLIISIIFIIIFSVTSYIFYPDFIFYINKIIGENLYATNITEGFMTRLKSSILLGIFFSIPLIIFQIIRFIFPALTGKEKAFFLSISIATYILFIFGIIFAVLKVMPISIDFLKSKPFFPKNINRLLSYDKFISFFFQFILAFGLCFQFPLVILLLLKLKLITLKFLLKNLKYFIVIIVIVAAVITPPDIVSQMFLAVPMLILYILSILIGFIFKLGK